MINRNVLSLLSLTVLCTMAFTAAAVFAQAAHADAVTDVKKALQQAETDRRRANEHCPPDAMLAATAAHADAVAAVEEAEQALAAAAASGNIIATILAVVALDVARVEAAQLHTALRATIEARRACLVSIGLGIAD